MERKFSTGIKILTTVAIAAEAVTACSPKNSFTPEPTQESHIFTPTEVSPTQLLNFRDYLPTPTQTARIETPEPLPFHLGELDMAVIPFTLKPTPELETLIGYVKNDWPETHADTPLPYGESDIGSEEQFELQGDHNETFEAAADEHLLNPYYVVQSDLPNHVFLNFHSVQESAPGDNARVLGGFVYKHEDDPEILDELYDQKFILTFKGHAPVEAQIVDVRTITKDYFDDLTATGPWGIDDNTGGLYGLTSSFGIPNTIRYDREPGVYYITIIGCQNKTPGNISLIRSQNVVNRSLLTLRIVLP